MGIKATLPKGTTCTLNGLDVVFNENLHFTVVGAENVDQAAECMHIHGLRTDFSHFDEEKNVNVRYSGTDAARTETEVTGDAETGDVKPLKAAPAEYVPTVVEAPVVAEIISEPDGENVPEKEKAKK